MCSEVSRGSKHLAFMSPHSAIPATPFITGTFSDMQFGIADSSPSHHHTNSHPGTGLVEGDQMAALS